MRDEVSELEDRPLSISRSPRRVKAVAFDLWETLITDTPHAARILESLRLERMQFVLLTHGHEFNREEVHEAYRALWDACLANYWSLDKDVDTRQQIVHFLEALEIDASDFPDEILKQLEDAYASAAIEVPPLLLPDASSTVKELRNRGFLLGLISNTGRTPGSILRRVLDSHGLSESFTAMVFSNEHGECKPQSSIFARLSEDLGVEPEEVVFVGDNLYCDIYGAMRVGMRAIHFDPPTRGLAVADPIDHGQEIVPDATIRQLSELPALLAEWQA